MRPRPTIEYAAGPPILGRWLPSGWLAPLLCAAVLRGVWLMSAMGGAFRGDEPAYVGLGRGWRGP